MKLIVGLGNYGNEYHNTRHNVGFMVLDNYLNQAKWNSNKLAYYIKIKIDGEDVIFIKPLTYMNLSGNAVLHFKNYYNIDIKDILIIHDDLDLPIGTYRLKINSSAGGHNGIKSIISCLNTKNFLRLKIGISKPESDVVDYVLHKFSSDELIELNKNYEVFNEIIDKFIHSVSLDKIMNYYNWGKDGLY